MSEIFPEQAKREGFIHYSFGCIDECPYREGSPNYQAWMDGYDEAQIQDQEENEDDRNSWWSFK